MSHPDASDQAAPAHRPAQDQSEPDAGNATGETVSTPEPYGERLAEAGHAYAGRELDDDLQANERLLDADRAVKEEGEQTGE